MLDTIAPASASPRSASQSARRHRDVRASALSAFRGGLGWMLLAVILGLIHGATPSAWAAEPPAGRPSLLSSGPAPAMVVEGRL